jgi:hypothetical protein
MDSSNELSLTDDQRDECLGKLNEDGFFILPVKLPEELLGRMVNFIDTYIDRVRNYEPNLGSASNAQYYYTRDSMVEDDPVWRELMMFKPALQLCHDVFGPMFHLSQDMWRIIYTNPHAPAQPDTDGWHSDGPRVLPILEDGRCPLYYLRFGYLLTDTTKDDDGTVEFVRGSHKRQCFDDRPLPGQRNKRLGNPDIYTQRDEGKLDFDTGRVTVREKAGTIVAFQNSLWHRTVENKSNRPRGISYFQYCLTMLRPQHRNVPYVGDMSHLTPEERWLLGEPRPATSWIEGGPNDWMRMGRFGRDVDSLGSIRQPG